MNSKYKVLKFNSNKFNEVEDLVSIEEPLEISLKFKEKNKWVTKILSITMRTPGDDKNLVRGFLFNEQIVQSIKDIDNIKSFGDKVGQYNIQNKILATLNNSENIEEDSLGEVRIVSNYVDDELILTGFLQGVWATFMFNR